MASYLLVPHCVTMAEIISCGVITSVLTLVYQIYSPSLSSLVPTLFFTGTLPDTLSSDEECSDRLPELPIPSTVTFVSGSSGDISYAYCEAVTERGTFRSDSVMMGERGK